MRWWMIPVAGPILVLGLLLAFAGMVLSFVACAALGVEDVDLTAGPNNP